MTQGTRQHGTQLTQLLRRQPGASASPYAFNQSQRPHPSPRSLASNPCSGTPPPLLPRLTATTPHSPPPHRRQPRQRHRRGHGRDREGEHVVLARGCEGEGRHGAAHQHARSGQGLAQAWGGGAWECALVRVLLGTTQWRGLCGAPYGGGRTARAERPLSQLDINSCSIREWARATDALPPPSQRAAAGHQRQRHALHHAVHRALPAAAPPRVPPCLHRRQPLPQPGMTGPPAPLTVCCVRRVPALPG